MATTEKSMADILAGMPTADAEAVAKRAGFKSCEEWDEAEKARLAAEAEKRRRDEEKRRRDEEKRRRDEAEARAPARMLEAGGFTRAASPADFDTLCKAVAEARRCGCGLLFTGGVGCGKTTAARAILPAAHEVHAGRLCRLYPQWESGDGGDLAEIFADGVIARGRGGDFVEAFAGGWILDDLGAEARVNAYGNQREYAGDFICEACDGADRRGCGLKAVITTNLHETDIAARYGARTASRLRAHFIPVIFHAGDLRARMPVFG